MWSLPRPGFKPVSPALAGGFLPTSPPGMSAFFFFEIKFIWHKFNHFRVNNSVAFSAFTMFCSYCLCLVSKHLHHPQKETLHPLAITPHASPPLSPRKPPVCFLCLWLSLCWIFHMSRNCTTGGLLRLASFTSRNVFKIPPYGISASFLLWLNSIPLLYCFLSGKSNRNYF